MLGFFGTPGPLVKELFLRSILIILDSASVYFILIGFYRNWFWEPVNGIVVAKFRAKGGVHPDMNSYLYKIKYIFDENEYEEIAQIAQPKEKYKIGNEIDIRVNNKDPKKFIIYDFPSFLVIPIIIVFGTVYGWIYTYTH